MATRWLGLGLGLLVGCTGIIETFDTSDPGTPDAGLVPDAFEPDAACVASADDLPPAKPTILTPAPVSGKAPLLDPAGISVTASAFSDPDAADGFGAADIEILGEAAGVPTSVVWRAHITDPAVLAAGVGLDDGQFVVTELFPWTEYFVRVRYQSNRQPCGAVGEFSDPVLFRTDDNSAYLFDDTVVREVRLYLPQASIDGMNAQAIVQGGCVPWSRDYYTGDLVYEGIRYNGVGAHVKGGCGSDRDLSGKPSLKIGLRWDDPTIAGCPDGRRILGQTHLTLNNGVQDCSHEHERVAYKLYAAMGVPVPRQNHIRVYINDVYYGLYLNLESFDRRMMARNFGDDRGMLYEGTYGCDLNSSTIDDDINTKRCDTEFSQTECDDPPEPGSDPQDFTPLRTFVAQIAAIPAGQFYPDAGQYLDMDEWLSLWAVNAVMDHWDDTFRGGNNHRVYHDLESGKWKLLSSGVDQTFAGERYRWWREINHVFSQRCFSERDCITAFEAKVDEAIVKLQNLDAANFLDTIHERIRPYAEIDTKRECDNTTWNNAHTNLKNWIASRPGRLPTMRLSDAFEADLAPSWLQLTTTPTASVSVGGGRLQIQQTSAGQWNNAEQGKFVYKALTGNFRMTLRARAEREAGGKTDQDNTFAGAMVQNPGGDDYVIMAVGRTNSGTSRLLRNVTTNGASVVDTTQTDPGDDSVTDLRICRVGNEMQVLKYDSGPDDRWELVGTQFTQPADFGATLNVGFMSSAGDTTPSFRAYAEYVDFLVPTDINQCDDK